MSNQDKTRYYLVDALRGLTLISMVLFHFSYDVFIVYGVDPVWYSRPWAHIWQQSICCTFILLSGFVWRWGRKGNLRRGLLLNLFGCIITAVTVLVMPSESIWFGVLNFMGCAVLLLLLLDKPLGRVPAALGLAVCFLLFLVFRNVQDGYLSLGSLWQLALPEQWYTTKLLTPLGFPFYGFWSSDYFPMLPWFFLYLCGYYLQPLFLKSEALKRLGQKKIPVLSDIGTKTVWVYMAHQPIAMGICMLIFGY